MLTSIVAAVVILGLLIIVHEAGHFVVAKRCGVRILRFSIGYPPKLFGIRRGETEYALGATPLGGYVRMLGDEIGDELTASDVETYLHEIGQDLLSAWAGVTGHQFASAASEDRLEELARRLGPGGAEHTSTAVAMLGRELKPEEALLLDEIRRRGTAGEAIKTLGESRPMALLRRIQERAFPSQSLAKRFAIVLAGPLANIAFAPLALMFVFMYGVPRLLPVLGQVKKDLPAYAAGLREGDRVLAINGRPMKSWEQLSQVIKQSEGAPLRLEYERRGAGGPSRGAVVLKAAFEQEKNPLGGTAQQWVIGVLPRGDSVLKRVGPLTAAGQAVVESAKMTAMLVVGIGKILVGATPVREALGGPIMIAKLAGQEAHAGLANVILFAVMLSIELGLINLFPVPMLDGGHLLFFLIEGVRGKPLKVRHREVAQQVGLFLLVVLMAFVIFNDVSRIVQG